MGPVDSTELTPLRRAPAWAAKTGEDGGHYARYNSVKTRVLVIEDSASVRRLIEVCLRVLDVEVISAEDGVKGLAEARANRPDVIVLDIGLPGMDGWEVLRRLRADITTQAIKVLVLTAHAQPEVAAQANAVGADDFMTKPFRPSDLRERIQGLFIPAQT